jgi:hypothetical protein
MRMPRTGVKPRTSRVPYALITLYNKYTYEIILCGCYACGPSPRAYANPRDTKNALTIFLEERKGWMRGRYILLTRTRHGTNYFFRILIE